MLRIIAKGLRTGILTERDPFTARPPLGFPVVDFERCTACSECARVCPTAAIQVTDLGERQRRVSMSHAFCIQCRECIAACPEQAISPDRDHEVAAYTRDQLVQAAHYELDPGGRVARCHPEPRPAPDLEQSAIALRERIRGRFGRSLHVRQVDAGSCNGCELEIAATTNPIFDLERFGIHFVASPRHADLLLVTGPVTRNMEVALRRTYDATPQPRVVVAVGACGCSGGIFGEGGCAAIGGIDRVVPVDVYVPGCPPRPQAILNGLLVAMGSRLARAVPDDGATSPGRVAVPPSVSASASTGEVQHPAD